MEKLLSKAAAIGVPIIWLTVAIGTAKASGLMGGAVMTNALKSIGPFGMKGGIATLLATSLATDTIAEFGIDYTAKSVINTVLKSKSPEDVKQSINKSRWISEALKLKINAYIDECTGEITD